MRGVSLTPELVEKMQCYPGVNWSGVARKAFTDLIDLLEAADVNDSVEAGQAE